jgi:hypothetical protein
LITHGYATSHPTTRKNNLSLKGKGSFDYADPPPRRARPGPGQGPEAPPRAAHRVSQAQPGRWALYVDALVAEEAYGNQVGFGSVETTILFDDQYAAWVMAVLLTAEPAKARRIYDLTKRTRVWDEIDRPGYRRAVDAIVADLQEDPRHARMLATTHRGIRYDQLLTLAHHGALDA